jgi:alginate O-acetyltransferase complex protein AlgJ
LISNAPLSTDSKSTSQLNQLEQALKLHVQPNWENIAAVGVFIAAVAFFTVAAAWTVATNQASISAGENRVLAPFPGLHTVKKDLPKFAQGFEKFYNDRFAFRLPLVASRNFVLFKALNSSGHNDVVIGENGWLYYVKPQALAAQANLEPLTETNLQAWGHAIQARKNFLAEHGIKYVFVIPPEKGSIFPENMPSRIHVIGGKTRLDQLQDYLTAHTDVDFIDAKALLLEAKSKPGHLPLYHKPDTHWNQYGSMLVTQELLAHIHNYFPAVEPFSLFDYRVATDYPFRGDLAKMLGLGDLFAERAICVLMEREKAHVQEDAKIAAVPDCWVPSFAWVNPNSTLPRVFVLRDSFSGYLIPFLAEKSSFSEFHWSHRLIAPLVLGQKPDLVVDEMAERHLYDYEPENAPQFSVNKSLGNGGNILANFDSTFELQNVVVRPSKTGMVVQLQWRSLSKQTLTRRVCLHAMSSSGVVLANNEFDQDAFGRTIPAFSQWTDVVEIPRTHGLKVTQLGINLHANDGTCMPAAATKTDWETNRVLLSLKDLDTRNAH